MSIYNNQNIYIAPGKLVCSDGTEINSEEIELKKFSKYLYKNLNSRYVKYMKMDGHSKLGWLAAEYLLKNIDLSKFDKSSIAQCFYNSSASYMADLKYQKSLEDVPSPALFVYTLPNVVMGELAISHGFKGENYFFVNDSEEDTILYEEIEHLLNENGTEIVIAGKIEVIEENSFFASLGVFSKKSLILNAKKCNNITYLKLNYE